MSDKQTPRWKQERDERLRKLGVGEQQSSSAISCIHCNQLFEPWQSTAADYGLCDNCLHKD
ncbi:hypothetical protein DEV91_12487 [Phyllobacterium brassicacearum]|nr:hypothetical protein DEV91_12487 [Phyllobacterium brassicacearum]